MKSLFGDNQYCHNFCGNLDIILYNVKYYVEVRLNRLILSTFT